MKKILLAVTAALAITGCSQNEEFENAGKDSLINFQSIVNNTTRATEMKITELQKQGFRVYAYNTGDGAIGTGVLDKFIMENELVSWSTDKWTSGTYYWPSKGNVQFFAYSSSKSLTLTAAKTDTYPQLVNYQVAATAAEQEDLLIATAYDKTKANPTVSFAFSHVLTQINFLIKSKLDDGLTYTVSKIEIDGVKNQGTFDYKNSSWDTLSGSTKYSCALDVASENNTVTGTTAKSVGTESLMLIPQSLGGVKILVSYTVTDKNGDEVFSTTTPKEVSFSSADAWEVGHRVSYTLSLTNDGTAMGWDVTSVGGWTDDTPEKEPQDPTPAE